MDRRRSIQWVLAALGTGGLGLRTAAAGSGSSEGTATGMAGAAPQRLAPLPKGPGYGTDPDLLRDYRPGDLWPLSFSAAHKRTAAAVCDLILPADERSPSASALGVVDFLDEWISAPYPDQKRDRGIVLTGLEALEAGALSAQGRAFAELDADAQLAIFEPLPCFARLRALTAAGFYSTPEGAHDLGFAGNKPSVHFAGPPPEVLRAAGLAPLVNEGDEAGWISLFDGQTLAGWQASDAPGTFSVAQGELIAHGPRSHLFYVGAVNQHDFRDFDFEAEILTRPHANSGVYFHTRFQAEGWPEQGYEVQVNNSHTDPSRTAGLYGIADNLVVPASDNQWFLLSIRVQGRQVVTRVNGRVICDYTEPEGVQRPPDYAGRLLGRGTFALQGHDPGSEIHYRNIRVRPLPR